MKLINLLIILAGSYCLLSVGAQADTRGVVLDGRVNEAPPSSCLSRERAEGEAKNYALKVAQTYCRSEGFGWRAASVKDFGRLDCLRCGDGRVSCAYSKVSLECRKAEPKLAWLGWLGGRP